MNTIVTSKDAILQKIREIVAREGLNALSIRRLANELGCSVGTIYYYFKSKDELIIEAIEIVWEDIFKADEIVTCASFLCYLNEILLHISHGIKKYPNFFTLHSIVLQTDEKQKAKSNMYVYMSKLKDRMKEVLASDQNVRIDTFTEEFTQDDFIDFIMSNIMSLILDPAYKKEFFIKLIERILY